MQFIGLCSKNTVSAVLIPREYTVAALYRKHVLLWIVAIVKTHTHTHLTIARGRSAAGTRTVAKKTKK